MSAPSAYAVLFAGLVLVSTAAPFLVSARMDAFAMAFWRLALSGGAFALVAAARGRWRIPAEAWPRLFASSALFAAHFALWIKAFDLTDYASNLLLLVSQPILAALVGARLGQRPSRDTWASVAIAVVGLGLIAGNDVSLGARALLGDLMAVLGGVTITLFYVVARRERAVMPLTTFLAVSMLLSAAWLVPVMLVAGSPWLPPSAASWGWLLALVFITTMAGHGLMNLAARHVSLFTLNVVIVLEPPIGILMGWPLFGASVTVPQAVGGAVLALAVVVGLRGAGSARPDGT